MDLKPAHVVEAAGGIPYRWTKDSRSLAALCDSCTVSSSPSSENRSSVGRQDVPYASDAPKHKRKAPSLAPSQYAEYDAFQGLEVCLVHRPKYDDWSWPKGKLEANESSRHAAVREIEEECGIPIRLGPWLGEEEYGLEKEGQKSKHAKGSNSASDSGRVKHISYWMATPISKSQSERRATVFGPVIPAKTSEIDEVRWMSVSKARKKLSHSLDRDILDRFVARVREGALNMRTLIIVRHGKAESRKHWDGTDANRPITPKGASASFALSKEIACFCPTRLVSSPWLRCIQTIEPYSCRTGMPVTKAEELTEEAFAQAPDGAWNRVCQEIEAMFESPREADDDHAPTTGTSDVADLLVQEPLAKKQQLVELCGSATIVCTHRPVIGGLFEHIRTLCGSTSLSKQLVAKTPYMPTANAVALFIVDGPQGPRIIDIQRTAPLVY